MATISSSPDDLLDEALQANLYPYTGREIISFRPDMSINAMQEAVASAGPAVLSGDLSDGGLSLENLGDAATLIFENLGLGLLSTSPEGRAALDSAASLDSGSSLFEIAPETFVFPQEDMFSDNAVTWGLDATGVDRSDYTGKNIRVAVLDTGMDLNHPDFVGREIVSTSFVPGQTAQDLHGHGTHCIGTACGPQTAPDDKPRYGIAYESNIYAGKVLSNRGNGTMGGILAGIDWAIEQKCEIISMSLGGSGGPRPDYDRAAETALAAGSLIIAASGNNSRRPSYIAKALAPANSADIMSVGAIDAYSNMASFSNGRKIEVVAPGVGVYSAIPMPRRYGMKSGTSMATPHVAGIAALFAQSDNTFRGRKLMEEIQRSATSLPFPSSDAGSGLVQAP